MTVILSLSVLAACQKAEPAPEPLRSVRTVVVGEESVEGKLELAAEIKARVESRLGFRVSGKLVKRYVELGQTVKAGQPLAQLDPEDFKLQQDAGRSQLNSARANLDLAQADFQRYQNLFEQGFIGAAELQRREVNLKAAQATFDQAQSQFSGQGNQLAYATLVADTAGVITSVDAEPGQVVSAGTPVVRIAAQGPRDVVFAVAEDKIDAMKALKTVKVKVWGQEALVHEVAAAADPVTRTYQVKADVGDADVRLGQTATVLLQQAPPPKNAGAASQALKLPLSALLQQGGKTLVWIFDPATQSVKSQEVRVAGADGNGAVISQGLTPGQRVVTAGVHVLQQGQKVKLLESGAAHDQ